MIDMTIEKKVKDSPARRIFEKISLCPHVLEVYLGRFSGEGAQREGYDINLSIPQEGSGHIFGKLVGPAAIGRIQEIDIRTTKNQEIITYNLIETLLNK